MSAFPNEIVIEYYNGSDWIDISGYVVSPIEGFSGMASNSPIDRTASLGTLEFALDNRDRIFTPYGGDANRGLDTLIGFNKGSKVKVRVVAGVYDDSTTVWTGRIDTINSDDNVVEEQRVYIRCVDWIDVATKFPMKGASIETSKRINQAMATLLGRVSIQPESYDFDTGENIFTAVFNNVREKTKAIGEINKLVMSELGYAYVKKDGTFKVENASARKGTDPLDEIPYTDDNLILVDGDDFLLTDGDTLLLDDISDAPLLYTAEELEISLPNQNLINIGKVTSYPTKTDTGLVVIYSLGSPLPIASGQSISFTAYYTDPNGGESINATNQQTPVATTDYLGNTASDGSGTNITANIVVSATYYGDSVDYTITNNNASSGYITFLQARGYGIYRYNSIQIEVEDTTSTAAYGDVDVDIDQRYKTDLFAGNLFTESLIKKYGKPKSRVTAIKFNANLNNLHLMAFLYLDIGSKIQIYENRSGITEHYYITSRKFSIGLAKEISCIYYLIPCSSYISGQLTPLVLKFNDGVTNSLVQFSTNTALLNLPKRSLSFWIYPTSNGATSKIVTINDGTFGMTTSSLAAFYTNAYTSGLASWVSPNSSITLNAWNHVVFTFDLTGSDLTAPLMYINGSSVAVSNSIGAPPTGVKTPKTTEPVAIGNVYNGTFPFYGYIKDFRIYKDVLTPGEVSTLYNSGSQDYSLVTDNLVFQTFFIHRDEGDATILDGDAITTQAILDNIFYVNGIALSTVYVDAP